jgi:hypothetical protein
MKLVRIALALLVPVAPLLFAPPLAAQGSDSCGTAQVISGPGPHAFDLTSATTGSDGQSNLACNYNGSTAILSDVWFRWTAPTTGTYLLTTCEQTSVDTKAAVYPGTTCPPANPVSCNDDGGNLQALARFDATTAQTFTIQLGTSPFGSPGTGTLRILRAASLSADDCNAPAALTGTGFFAYDYTIATTGTQGQSNPGCVNVQNDLWFSWTAPITGMAHLDTCGQTAGDTAVAVYAGTGCPASTSIICDDDACNLQSYVQWPVSSGASYMLQIGKSGGTSPGWGTLRLDITPVPANDDCSAPASAGAGGVSYDNTTATTGTQGQANPCGGIDKDLWFTWTASVSGTATIDSCFQTSVNTSLAVYPGTGCPSTAALACNDDACGGQQSQVAFPVYAGAMYTIQIGSSPGSPGGPSSFTIQETPSGGGPGIPFCSGDGTGTACPCGNSGNHRHGCANSVNPAGGQLTSTGDARFTADTLVLLGSGMPPGTTTIYYQGTLQANNGAGVVLGDGLRCVAGTVIRLGVKHNTTGGSSGYGGPLGDVPISVRGMIPPTGATREYQVYYRNPANFCTSATFNLTNGLEVTWVP